MAISEKIASFVSQKNQMDRVIEARAIEQQIRSEIDLAVTRLNAIKNEGSLADVDAEITQPLNAGLTALETCQAALSTADMQALLGG
jgi:hypothetical protein